MELRKDYKLTELGIIPNDWTICKLGQLATIKDGTHQTPKYVEIGVPFYSVETVTDNDFKNTKFISEEEHALLTKTFSIEKDDVLMTRIGSIGDCRIVDWEPYASFYVSLALLKFKNKNNAKYFARYSKSNYFKIEIELNSLQHAIPKKINLGQINEVKIAIPKSESEQTAIATALSDADAYISSLEKLIEKKRNIKQSLIKQLLVGKKRLEGFKGSWVEKPFSQVCWYQEGPGLRNWQFTSDGIKVINVTNLVDGYLNLERTTRHISWNEFNKMYKHFEIDPLDIVVASSGNSYAKVAVVRKEDLRLVMNTSVIRFKPLKELDYNFLLAFLNSNLFKDQIDLLITGGAQPNFGPFHLNKISIKVPPTKDEQIVIGNIIKDAEDEIESLLTKLIKAKQIKQGMMQELLTGKIRLV